MAGGRSWGHAVGQILLVPYLPELPSMEGAPSGHTPGEISSVWGSSTAADVVGGGRGDRDTLGGCAVGEEFGEGNTSGYRAALCGGEVTAEVVITRTHEEGGV